MTFNLSRIKTAEAAKHPTGPQPGSGPGSISGQHGGRKRIKDRGIEWKEHYGEKSVGLKKKFDEEIGPISYMRWEGHDYSTNGDYFIVVGPAITADEDKKFFSGIKRLPDDPTKTVYSPSGEYFENSHAAFSHASDKWGVPFPKGSPKYDHNVLMNIDIPRHVKG